MTVVAMWDRSPLEDRIMRILNNPDRRGLGRLAAAAMSLTALLAIAPLASVTVLAQNIATLQGVVNDPSGARVPGAMISIGEKSRLPLSLASTVSGPDGTYKLPFAVPEGSNALLMLRVEKPGFAAAMHPIVKPQRDMIQDIHLSVGQLQETMMIEGVRPANLPPKPANQTPQRIRVGGNVQAANLIQKTNPEYPKELQDKGIEGTVELEAILSREGHILSLHPRSRTVDQGLIDAATRAVQTWLYRPTLLNGLPIEVVTTVTVRFYLK